MSATRAPDVELVEVEETGPVLDRTFLDAAVKYARSRGMTSLHLGHGYGFTLGPDPAAAVAVPVPEPPKSEEEQTLDRKASIEAQERAALEDLLWSSNIDPDAFLRKG